MTRLKRSFLISSAALILSVINVNSFRPIHTQFRFFFCFPARLGTCHFFSTTRNTYHENHYRNETQQDDAWNNDASNNLYPFHHPNTSTAIAPPDPLLNTNDDPFRYFRKTVPLPIQYFLRDSGLLRFLVDSLIFWGIPALLQTYPTAWDDFQQLSGRGRTISFQTMKYGQHRAQIIETIRTQYQRQQQQWIVFVHGGAWGSGFPLMYRLVANSFLQEGFQVAIVGYRTYPDTNVNGQIEDIVQALDFLRESETNHYNSPITTLIGHSSGAHITMLGLLQSKIQGIEQFVGISGVYDIPQHYQYESKRGVERFSPLAPACGGTLSEWKHNSPSRWHHQPNEQTILSMPRMLLLHGANDTTVPYTSSIALYQSLTMNYQGIVNDKNSDMTLKILPDVEHSETILHLMFGGMTRDVLLTWIQKYGSTID